MLEIRLYSTEIATLAELEAFVDWDCTYHSAVKYCEMCPSTASVYTLNKCLEDMASLPYVYSNLVSSYKFDSSVSGVNRYYYSNLISTT